MLKHTIPPPCQWIHWRLELRCSWLGAIYLSNLNRDTPDAPASLLLHEKLKGILLKRDPGCKTWMETSFSTLTFSTLTPHRVGERSAEMAAAARTEIKSGFYRLFIRQLAQPGRSLCTEAPRRFLHHTPGGNLASKNYRSLKSM